MNTDRLHLLIVEDEEAHVEAVRRAFDAAGTNADIHAVGTLRQYLELVAEHPIDIALVDLNLPDGRAVEILTHPPEDAPFPILVMTAFGNQQIVVEVMKAGALDYVVKSPEAFAMLPRTVEVALREWKLLQERRQAEKALQEKQILLSQAETLGKVGGWEFDVETRQQTWTEMVYDIHELDGTVHPTVDQGINFYTPESQLIIAQAVQRAIEHGEPFNVELEIITAKGNLRSVHAIGRADVARRKVYGSIQDITERKRADEMLRQRAEELDARNKELERFNRASVGRELRMVELKKEINQLCQQAGLPLRYPLNSATESGKTGSNTK